MAADILGTLIGNRFQIEADAGSGGMGVVYKARDRHAGGYVALKLIRTSTPVLSEQERFAREAKLLAQMRHPGIVSYVAHGISPQGEPYLAMEWLEGEDLVQRLTRGALDIWETLTLARKVAEALVIAHQHGVIHRDLKPSNLFLREGQVEKLALLDFGIALRTYTTRPITKTGILVGTPGYMAPEQARGDRAVGPQADIFSLGCVLFECLTGSPPFIGDHIAAVLAKVLFNDPPSLRGLRPDTPAPLTKLVERMLSKDPALRPADMPSLLEELAPIAATLDRDGEADAGPAMSLRPPSLTEGEKRLICAIVASDRELSADEMPTLGPSEHELLRTQREGIQLALKQLGARAELITDGSLVATLTKIDIATDQAAQGARCALVVRSLWPTARIAMAMGPAIFNKGEALGAAIELAVRLFERPTLPALGDVASDAAPEGPGVRLDELSARLLYRRFEVTMEGGNYVLLGERAPLHTSRLVMGKPTPCVGREQELSQLEAVLRSCIEESTARVVLVTAPSGYGKTRLRHEFLRRVERSGERVEVLVGYGNPRGEDLLFPVLRNALVTLFGFQSSDAGVVTAQKLLDRVSLRVDPAIAGRVSALLGELCGAPVGDDGSAELREARKDPKGMADLIARAFMDLLRAECKAGPVLLLLEDLQWIDAPTLRLLDGALRELAHEPFMVLALSRPEIEELLPKLWNERGALRLRLPGLSRKASKRLVAEVLGVGADSPAVERIAGQAQGNALLLEELMRAEMEGREDAPPDTALAILQSYMLRLDTNTRRVLRGAAIFGGTFWRGGLNALYASSITAQMLDASLTALVDAAFIERRPESRFEGEVEYAFCHALLRDAAYRLLTDEDRALGHRIVGEYMTRMGEPEAEVVARHFRLAAS